VKIESDATSRKGKGGGSTWFHRSVDKMKDSISKMFLSKSEL
jgi:hypothetical protein